MVAFSKSNFALPSVSTRARTVHRATTVAGEVAVASPSKPIGEAARTAMAKATPTSPATVVARCTVRALVETEDKAKFDFEKTTIQFRSFPIRSGVTDFGSGAGLRVNLYGGQATAEMQPGMIALAILAPMADRRGDEAALDVLLVMEASLTFAVVQQGLTAMLPRERPEVHGSTGDARVRAVSKRSSFESFPAGHNGEAFAIAAAGGTVATMRGYKLAPLVWISGGVLALAISYLRIAADRHYFTDILTGAGLGIGIGIGVPLLFHRPEHGEKRAAALRWLDGAVLSTSEVPGGRVVGIGSTF